MCEYANKTKITRPIKFLDVLQLSNKHPWQTQIVPSFEISGILILMKFYILLFLNYNLAAFVHRKDARKNIREMEREEIKQAKMAEMIIKGQIDRLKCKLKYYNNVVNFY